MAVLELIVDSLPHAPGGGLGPGGAMLGGPPSILGGGPAGEPSQGPGDEENDEPFFFPDELKTITFAKEYGKWLTGGGSTGNNALRTVTAFPVLPMLAVIFVLELSVRNPGL